MARWIFLPLGVVLLATASLVSFQWAKSSVAKDIYRERLTGLETDLKTLSADYNRLTDKYNHLTSRFNDLADQYNEAITPRPVTELWVEEGIVCLVVRKGDGEIVRIPTGFNVREKEKRVYVDYLVVDQRVMIFVAFEFNQKPGEVPVPMDKVVYIDPDLLEIEKNLKQRPLGKGISVAGKPDGRYVVTATTNGSLDLTRIDPDADVELEKTPKIKHFDPVTRRVEIREQYKEIQEDVSSIGVGDVWRHLTD